MSSELTASFDFASRFQAGLDYETFLERHGSDSDRAKWARVYNSVQLSEQQTNLLESFAREMKVICMAGAWCGDCVAQCPIFRHFEQTNRKIQVRFIDRDADVELASELKICAAPRVPQVVFLSEDDFEVGRFGDRTLTKYRQLAGQITGDSCASGVVVGNDPVFQGVIQDWLDEFERTQLILRMSPRLRRKHED